MPQPTIVLDSGTGNMSETMDLRKGDMLVIWPGIQNTIDSTAAYLYIDSVLQGVGTSLIPIPVSKSYTSASVTSTNTTHWAHLRPKTGYIFPNAVNVDVQYDQLQFTGTSSDSGLLEPSGGDFSICGIEGKVVSGVGSGISEITSGGDYSIFSDTSGLTLKFSDEVEDYGIANSGAVGAGTYFSFGIVYTFNLIRKKTSSPKEFDFPKGKKQ